MSRRQNILLGMSIVGFFWANTMVTLFFVKHGSVDFPAYFKNWFASLPATQIAIDIGIAFVAFSVWAAWEGRRLGMRSWWMPVPASLGIGLCFALPLFLFLRDRKLHGQLTPAPKAEAQTPSTSPDSAVAALGRERDSVWMPGGVRTEIHLDGEETGGSFCLLVDEPPTGWALPTHLHSEESETIHIVEGEFEMITDGERSILGPGDTAHVPVGIEHSGANLGASPGRRIVIFSPAGMEELFRELGTHDPSQLVDAGIALAAATRFGWRFGEAG